MTSQCPCCRLAGFAHLILFVLWDYDTETKRKKDRASLAVRILA